jgi:hypothetical protein
MSNKALNIILQFYIGFINVNSTYHKPRKDTMSQARTASLLNPTYKERLLPRIEIPAGHKLIVVAGDVYFNEIRMGRFTPKAGDVYIVQERLSDKVAWIHAAVPKGGRDISNDEHALADASTMRPHQYFVRAYELNVVDGQVSGYKSTSLFVDIRAIPSHEPIETPRPDIKPGPVHKMAEQAYQAADAEAAELLKVSADKLRGMPKNLVGYFDISKNKFSLAPHYGEQLKHTAAVRTVEEVGTSGWCCC